MALYNGYAPPKSTHMYPQSQFTNRLDCSEEDPVEVLTN
jgi:hypothetical protein